MLREDGGESAEAAGGLDVADNSDDDHRRRLEDGDGVNDLALVHLGARAVDSTDNVSHTGLVSAEGSEVGGGGGVIIAGERTDASRVALRTLFGEESQVTARGASNLR